MLRRCVFIHRCCSLNSWCPSHRYLRDSFQGEKQRNPRNRGSEKGPAGWRWWGVLTKTQHVIFHSTLLKTNMGAICFYRGCPALPWERYVFSKNSSIKTLSGELKLFLTCCFWTVCSLNKRLCCNSISCHLIKPQGCFLFFRLHDVLHSDKKLTLVFEYCDQVRESDIYSFNMF